MTAAPANRTQAELHCVRCGQSGHLSKDCPWPANSRARAPISRARALELFDYSCESGGLTWRARGERADKPHNLGYRFVEVDKRRYLVHRLAWLIVTGEWPVDMVDHINGNRSDNRWTNLRAADKSINAQNQTKPMSTNTSGFLGVSRDSRREKCPWRAAIQIRGRYVYLGLFETPEAAYEAYIAAKRELHPGCHLARGDEQ